jgi:hypothetical protein
MLADENLTVLTKNTAASKLFSKPYVWTVHDRVKALLATGNMSGNLTTCIATMCASLSLSAMHYMNEPEAHQ